ncbi:NAD(P)-dependent oxidoreductase [Nocardiopsis changdeensis]|uniref:NAD(P)-dependent oxidoreductase n=1 Tax=Nocardiopsis changdeensis TaxID=2831969 RepID=A0ABX8BNH7_9ACTN|nr:MULTISPECIES: NAD(P)-binding domain-containing protein [Nocardiopsis]QUX23795.1 NAD(P)-dependent oxidoreductase [Nocardiopsis changdeensis]QYX39740.1 NAD(P)-binding domain-containing protein [Nocardiopsis sp. MT53]
MTENTTDPSRIVLLGLGDMGTAFARAWLAAGHPLTVWNRTASRAEPLAAEGADVAADPASAVAAGRLVVTCLFDDASVGSVLEGVDLAGRDLVDITTGTPGEARARAEWAAARGARFVSGGIMAVPPMVGALETGAYTFYSGSEEAFAEHREALSVPTGARFQGGDPGLAALLDVALLSAMNGMFGGLTHAFALARRSGVPPKEAAALLEGWVGAMLSDAAGGFAERLESGDLTTGVVSNLAMQSRGLDTLLRTAREAGVSTELLRPYADLMERHVADGGGDQDGAGLVDRLLEDPA